MYCGNLDPKKSFLCEFGSLEFILIHSDNAHLLHKCLPIYFLVSIQSLIDSKKFTNSYS